MQGNGRSDWLQTVSDETSVRDVIDAMGEFQQRFCDHMVGNRDFTLGLELHGDKGKVLHVRFRDDSFRRSDDHKEKTKSGTKKFVR